jgi:hypothetical protein
LLGEQLFFLLRNTQTASLRERGALDKEDYLLCKVIKDELSGRKNAGELNNEVIDATIQAYSVHGKSYKDMQYKVFREMLEEIKIL